MTNTTVFNSAFDATTIQKVWNKGRIILGYDPQIYRHDTCGKVMRRSDYGDTDSSMGWEIDHIFPKSKGGTDHINNLQPLQWENNRKKGDTFPWSCN